MRIADDLHALATAATRAVDLFERYLQLRVQERTMYGFCDKHDGKHERLSDCSGFNAMIVNLSAPDSPLAGPAYYDTELNLRLNDATEQYITEHGEWPTEKMRREFIENGVDFSQL